jgi:hypothetical protein
VTAARPYEEREPGTVMSIKAEGKARLMREPEYGEAEKPIANVLAFQNKKPDPLASLAASFKRLPASRNAEIVTTPVRYHLDTDLFKAFEPDQVQEYKAQLIAEGRWRLPNDGGPYTIRFNYLDVPEVFGFNDQTRASWSSAYGRSSFSLTSIWTARR